MTQTIYGWHIIHVPSNQGIAFCSRITGGKELTEEDVLCDFEPREDYELIPLIRADKSH